MKEKINDLYEKLKKFNIKISTIIILIIMIVVIIIVLVIYLVNINKDNYKTYESNTYLNNSEISNVKKENNEIIIEKIKIHISGEVQKPGIYELEENSRIADAIEIAGGLTQYASLDKVNLAYILSDGQKIKIPCINNEENVNTIIEELDNEIIESINSNDKKVNINTATLADLTSISGIGESTAKKIIDYRSLNGKFKTVEDIKNVSRNRG